VVGVVSGVHRSGRGSVTRDPRLSLHAQVSNIRLKDKRLDQTEMTGMTSSGIAQLNNRDVMKEGDEGEITRARWSNDLAALSVMFVKSRLYGVSISLCLRQLLFYANAYVTFNAKVRKFVSKVIVFCYIFSD
jgi:hypothetical protein